MGGERPIDQTMAEDLALLCGNSVHFWLNCQERTDGWCV